MYDYGWSEVGSGGYEGFSQNSLLRGEQYDDVKEGICQALCQVFVDLRIDGAKPKKMVTKLKNRLDACADRQRQIEKYEGNRFTTPGGHTAPYKDWKKGGMFKDVNGPKSLAKKMVEEPSVSVFSFHAAFGSEGHDVAYDSRNGELHFFDPNCGYFFAENPNEEALVAFMKDVWSSHNYSRKGRMTTFRRKIYAVS